MFRRIAHFLRFGKKDEALEKRFAKIKEKYLEASAQGEVSPADPIGHLRITGNFDKRTVTGAATVTREKITEELLKSCARAVGPDSE
jgi:hypothetical protein